MGQFMQRLVLGVAAVLILTMNIANAKGTLDVDSLSVLKKFNFFKQEKCLITLLDDWTRAEIEAVQDTIDNVGLIFLQNRTELIPKPSNHFCQVHILKNSLMLDYVETLCEFKMKTKCITVLVSISGQPVNTAKESTNLSIPVIQINFQTSPKPYATYSLWYPQCGNFFKNVFILNGKMLRTNKGVFL